MLKIEQVTDIERLLKMRMEVLRCVFSLGDDYDMEPLAEANRKFYEQSLENGTHVSLEAFYIPDSNNNNATGNDVKDKDNDCNKDKSFNQRCSSAGSSQSDQCSSNDSGSAKDASISETENESAEAEAKVDPDVFLDDSDYMLEYDLEEYAKPSDDNGGFAEKRYLCGSADLCLYQEMPSPDNPTGGCAYIMNVYVREKFRHHGVATKLVKELISIARQKGCGKVYLESTKMAKPLYKDLGFCDMEDMLHLPIQ